MRRFSKQVAIITGGASGIGKAIGMRLSREGARIILVDIRKETLEEAQREFQQHGLEAQIRQLDISDEQAVETTINEIADQYGGRLDIMVNSAAVVGPTATKITDYSVEDFRKVVEINLTGAFLMTKYCIPHMEQQQYGRILLIASIGGKEGNPGMAGYAASKSGVMGLIKGIGKEYAKAGITVNGIAPAVIATPMNMDTDPAMLEYMTAKIPMGRLGTVDEVAAMACWIVSEEASFNTGCVFDLSGGRATF